MSEERTVNNRGGSGAEESKAARADSAVWDLALRLVPQHYGPHGESPEPPRLWPGRLPDLPFELPIPDGARLVGSYGRGLHLTVLIDTAMGPKQTVASY